MPKIARGKASLLGAIPDPAPADTDQFMDSFSRTGKEALLESFKRSVTKPPPPVVAFECPPNRTQPAPLRRLLRLHHQMRK